MGACVSLNSPKTDDGDFATWKNRRPLSPRGPPPSGFGPQYLTAGRAVPLPLPAVSPAHSSGSESSSSDSSSSGPSRCTDCGSIAGFSGNDTSFQEDSERGSSRGSCTDVRMFSSKELQAATRYYRPDLLLGEGGFGKVYLGWIDESKVMPAGSPSGRQVAVKRLNQGGLQGHKEWMTEITLLSQLSHANLVQLVGYSLEPRTGERGLVYEYMPRGSLEHYLFADGETLTWHQRIKIGLQVAQGLAYLHDDTWHQQIIYRDFKASNILLTEDFTAKLSDFGLAREAAKPQGPVTHVTTEIMGTFGYTAPEYLMKGHLSARSDVYSFGVVLLEILTGLQSMDKVRPAGQHNLVQYAAPYLEDKRRLYKIIDPRLEGNYSIKAARAAADIARQCLEFNPRQRPTMDEVVDRLRPLVLYGDMGSPPKS